MVAARNPAAEKHYKGGRDDGSRIGGQPGAVVCIIRQLCMSLMIGKKNQILQARRGLFTGSDMQPCPAAHGRPNPVKHFVEG